MIRLSNIDNDSYLKTLDLEFQGSAGATVVGHNLGIVPIACEISDLLISTTASALTFNAIVKVNNVTATTFVIPALAISGGVQLIAGPTSPQLITAGSLISIDLSATATIAGIVGMLRFDTGRAEK